MKINFWGWMFVITLISMYVHLLTADSTLDLIKTGFSLVILMQAFQFLKVEG